MKASLKLREDRTPLLRAKFPVGILGFPFVSGITGGDPGDLSFSLQTAWIPGLSLKVSYRPNDAHRPFVFAVKSGIGHSSSPERSPVMVMAAEFSLLRKGAPCFLLQMKPEFGDFSAKKSVASQSENPSRLTGATEMESSRANGMFEAFEKGLSEEVPVEKLLKFEDAQSQPAAAATIRELFSGTAITARTRFPLRKNVALKVRWGMHLPPDWQGASVRFRGNLVGANFPFLTVDKISIENVEPTSSIPPLKPLEIEGKPSETGISKVMLYTMKEELETLRRENGLIRDSIQELKSRLRKENGGSLPSIEVHKMDDGAKKKTGGVDNGIQERKSPAYSGRTRNSNAPSAVDVSEELKKAIKGATGA
ncbi:uncharacterized protein LOC116265394 [Nymphaea colorata]|uniref:Uncharacterized protein n=1 Tax=Nymphaea colorata TaxID=210225 RepID=A0A5K0YUD1_9MAGN|nr:uncharacterized protein LOC116265394 [Nymphaea colorata]VVV81068.1 unnamed protein product [Nymphaea colorata]